MNQPSKASHFSSRLFYRAYFAVVICIVVIGSLLDYLASQTTQTDRLSSYRDHVEPVFQLTAQHLNDHPESDWRLLIDQTASTLQRSMVLFVDSDFSADPEFHQQLMSGELVPLFDHQDELTFYQRIKQSPYILAIELPDFNVAAKSRVWLVTSFYILIALAIFLLLKPFTRDLAALKHAAASLGQNDFSTRINVTSQSSLKPVLETFNHMAVRIENLVTSQRDLSNAVSHELRTPLARLKFAFEAIESDSPQLSEAFEAMREDVAELEALIDEMMLYAQINQIQELNTAVIPLAALIDQVIAHEGQAHIKLTVSPSFDLHKTHINCDGHHLLRALRNVVRNAVRFAHSQCQIRVELDQDHLWIDVDDDGPGLPEEQAERIFEPFYRLDRRSQSEGFGLGLSIARRVMEKHHGHLSLVPSRLGGACFRFSFPANIMI